MFKPKVIVDLFYDISSPYAWCAFELLIRHSNVWQRTELKLKPFLLLTVHERSKNVIPCNAKLNYMASDWKMLGDYYKIPFHVVEDWSLLPDTKKAMRFLTAVEATSDVCTLEKASRELFWRVYGNNRPLDVTSDSAFGDVCKKCDVQTEVLKLIDSEETRKRLIQYTEEAIAHGSFGAPTMVAHLGTQNKLFFGHDRIELLSYYVNETYHGPLLQYNAFK